MAKRIRVVLADDHKLLRAGLKLLLEANSSIEVVGEASDGLETIELLEKITADVAIIDLSMPNMDGIACIKEIKSKGYKLSIIVLTMHEDENYIKEVMHAGAMAYIQKASVDTELFQAIQAVSEGRIYLSQQSTQALLSLMLHDKSADERNQQDPYSVLSAREREVLKLLAYGYAIGEIAATLSISTKTVDTYKTRIMEKLNFTHKREIVSYALKYHLLS
ncbi:MAG: two component transcriptional regulator, LuxR family [Pelosinus sp.]|nr:two component transcriptional regulator, LuxR family [Pelosinus sp.]